MATINGSLASVNSVPTEGTVLLRALELRPGSTFAVTGEPKVAVIKGGQFTIENVEPGPVQLTIQGNGVTHDVRVDVPERDEVDFLELMDNVYEWEPEQVSAVKEAAREARKAADEAGRIASAFRGAGQLEGWAESASSSADAADKSARAAASSAGAAKADAGKAASSATAAGKSATAAEGSASAAKTSADAAGKSATAAASSASAAKADAGKAATSATEASNSARSAKADADRAVGVVDSVQWNDDKLTVAGKTSPSLRGEKGEPGGVRGVAIEGTGEDPQATGERSVALGWNAEARGRRASALGIHTLASQSGSTAVGYNSLADSAQATAVGVNAKGTGFNSLALGNAAESRGDHAIAIGDTAQAASKASIAIGPSHNVATPGETHIGVPKRRADQLKVSSHVVLHGTAEATEPATKPEHLASKKMVDDSHVALLAEIEKLKARIEALEKK